MSNTRGRNIDSARRDDRRIALFDQCEIIQVHPHVDPYPTDKNWNVCDVKLIDRRLLPGESPIIRRIRLKCLQRSRSCHLQGETWNPRIGEQVLIAWISNREGVILGTIPSAEEEPLCRSEATMEDQEFVFKRSPWEEPRRNAIGDFVEFPAPKHPDCHKWWPFTRDSIYIHDCANGHARPECDALAPCTCLDDHQVGSTWLKLFSDISPTLLDAQRRVKFHHYSGSILYFDADGSWGIAGKTFNPATQQETTKGLIRHYPTGTIKVRSEPMGTDGAMGWVVAVDDTEEEIAAELIWEPEETRCRVTLYKDGHIEISGGAITISGSSIDLDASESISLTAPEINITESG